MDEPVSLPIDGELDLHTFRPSDLKELVPAYLDACRERSILEVRIIHGKGIGNLRRSVHALLGRLPVVASFAQASELYGGAGATFVRLHPANEARGTPSETVSPPTLAESEPRSVPRPEDRHSAHPDRDHSGTGKGRENPL
jgi:hypothetical protein